MKVQVHSYSAICQNLNLKNSFQNNFNSKIIYFTGKNNASDEVKEVLDIADSLSLENLVRHVRILSEAKMAGRGVGDEGIKTAKHYISSRFADYGLLPFEELGLKDYFEDFKVKQIPVKSLPQGDNNNKGVLDPFSKKVKHLYVQSSNIAGKIKGTESPENYIILTAHYDHLGTDKVKNIIYPGADDDATGVACLLEIARVMQEKFPPKKSVIFVALSAEETNHNGASQLASDLLRNNIADQVEILNIEMLGGIGGHKLDVWGDDRLPASLELSEAVLKAGKELGVQVKINNERDPGSDAFTFNQNLIPAILLLWDFDKEWKYHPNFHTSEDKPEKINNKVFYEAARVIAGASLLAANNTDKKKNSAS